MGQFEWCHPGDDQRRRWLLVFDDADRGNCVFYDEDEAHEAFARADTNWNCHLFESAARKPNRRALCDD